MDRVERYQPIIKRILGEHLEYAEDEEQVETFAICDEEVGHYMLVEIGWQYPQRVYNVVFHIHLRDNKIWIHQDWTEYGVARELIEAGVPSQLIVLGFQPPDIRSQINLALSG
jgi:hypothetical protein